MESNRRSQIDFDWHVAKYMDERGCSLQQACEDLGINESNVFNLERRHEELY
ncbi:hypothetical protein [Clostridium saccharobutylicum]|uniref:XRE family transcriptional regulator n=1 Tax=Clostridium saccharobutylicum TaxID=169679 RepID=A0A1S8NJU9_CLOSA|nr:hypothetical protein [Clostridium saccharobutylicum]OOM16652.1 hypothetical protein CLOSAC_09260 [Clostridium saccharobutylicum]